MKTFIVASRDDAAGFALAGVEPITREQIDKIDPKDSIVIVSHELAHVVADRLLPFVVILPER